MHWRDAVQVVGSALVVAIITFWAPEPERSQAQSPPLKAPTSVKLSVSQLSPVPVYSIFPPKVLRRLADRASRQLWKIPEEKTTWPRKANGKPVIETERLDRLYHTVEEGQTLKRIRTMFHTSTSRLSELNPGVDLHDLDGGERLLVWRRDESSHSVSYGEPHWGRLYHGEPLPKDENYVLLFQHRTFGTYYAVSETQRLMNEFYERYPNARRLMIGDISFHTGGPISPHRSHRTGRDIDISYPRLNDPEDFNQFHYVRRDELDVKKTLFLVRELIEGGYVEYIFMDHWFQRMLYNEAKRQGAPEKWLETVFEYPEWGGATIIQHEPGHRNHMHIRFKCQPTDRRCD